jgi:DNA-binding response OmpR family regulator
MPGERILVADHSVAVQELCRTALESQGYRVTVASNGVAALSCPDIESVDLLIVDTALKEMSGLDTTRAVRTDAALYPKPVLLLVPEGQSSDRASQDLHGANGYLVKPFEAGLLVAKVQALLEEKQTLERSREHLKLAAEAWMQRLAESHIQQAVEQRTQIIIERALQNIVSMVDQKTRREVDARVTQLTAEKEQELVKMTVHEVARSMVEKLAERKVTEAMEGILRDETEKAVRRVAESVLPGLARERVRESAEQVLPREVQRRVQKEAETLVPEASEKVVQVIESAAQKLVPKIARELTAEQVERQAQEMIHSLLPRQVQAGVAQELETQLRTKITPVVNDAAEEIARRMRKLLFAGFALALIWALVVTVLLMSQPRAASRPAADPAQAAQMSAPRGGARESAPSPLDSLLKPLRGTPNQPAPRK